MLLPFDMIGRRRCTRKNGAPTLTANSLSKSSTVVSSMVAAFENPRIGDQNVEAISDNVAGLPGKLVSAIRGGKVRGYGIRALPALRISATTPSASFAPRP
jgi:hypothetical protein